MTILARRFVVICLIFSIFAVALTMIVEAGGRRGQLQIGGLHTTPPCATVPASLCKAMF